MSAAPGGAHARAHLVGDLRHTSLRTPQNWCTVRSMSPAVSATRRPGPPTTLPERVELRLPEGTRERLRGLAERRGRQLSEELRAALAAHLDAAGRESSPG